MTCLTAAAQPGASVCNLAFMDSIVVEHPGFQNATCALSGGKLYFCDSDARMVLSAPVDPRATTTSVFRSTSPRTRYPYSRYLLHSLIARKSKSYTSYLLPRQIIDIGSEHFVFDQGTMYVFDGEWKYRRAGFFPMQKKVRGKRRVLHLANHFAYGPEPEADGEAFWLTYGQERYQSEIPSELCAARFALKRKSRKPGRADYHVVPVPADVRQSPYDLFWNLAHAGEEELAFGFHSDAAILKYNTESGSVTKFGIEGRAITSAVFSEINDSSGHFYLRQAYAHIVRPHYGDIFIDRKMGRLYRTYFAALPEVPITALGEGSLDVHAYREFLRQKPAFIQVYDLQTHKLIADQPVRNHLRILGVQDGRLYLDGGLNSATRQYRVYRYAISGSRAALLDVSAGQ